MKPIFRSHRFHDHGLPFGAGPFYFAAPDGGGGGGGSTSGGSGAGLPPNDPASGTKDDGSGTPGGEGKAGADGSGAGQNPGMSQAEAVSFAQRRVKEVIGAEMGRLRQAGNELGIEIGREATLKDVTELVLKQAKELAEMRASTKASDGDGQGGEKEKTFTQAEVNRIVKEKLTEAGKAWVAKEAEYQAKLGDVEKRSTAFVLHQEVRRLAAEKGLVAQGVIDYLYSPFTDFPYEIVLGDKPGSFKVLDKADRTEAINPRTRDVFTLADVIEDLKARKDLAHLVVGRVAGGGGGGAESRSGADGGPVRTDKPGARPVTARDFYDRAIKNGLLEKTKLGE